MRIERIDLINFMAFDKATIELPDTGLVLITGENGSGKSSCCEAIPAALWNKTMRGTPWWRPKVACSVGLRTNEIDIVRTRTKGGKNEVEIRGGPSHGTGAKAGKTVADIVSTDFETWRKTSFFSSDAIEGSNFSGSTDGGRKRLIETILGLDRFDPALKQCRLEISNLDRQHARAAGIIRETELEIAAEIRRAEEAKESLRLMQPAGEPKDVDDLMREIRAVRADSDGAKKDLRRIDRSLASTESEVERLRASLEPLSADECPTCTQAIPEALVARLTAHVAQLEKKAVRERSEIEGDRASLVSEIDEMDDILAHLQSRYREVLAMQKHAAGAASSIARMKRIVENATGSIESYGAHLEAARVELEALSGKRATMGAVEDVLGLKGVRAHVLGSMLLGVEEMANRWLELMGHMRISLTSAKGDVPLDVDGAGGGFGYKACSTGQRRRIDVPLLLSLAKVSAAAHGVEEGTLLLDEVLDSLDEGGVDGISAALNEMAEDRCVVVVSHSEEVGSVLSPAVRWHVADGKVRIKH